ncbi:uncharacterized protein PWA37_002372 [Arxiozyma heterogenica]|uniref:uncharacterized protein n=1 Tax=Arxiozyma heterogenica TaxID=278026 RepID=UPI002F1CCDF9
MNSKDDVQREEIVPICVFCRKYNISNKRAMSIGIDNSSIEAMTEQEFEKILFLCKEMEKEENATTFVSETDDTSVLDCLSMETTKFKAKRPLKSLFQEDFQKNGFSKDDWKRSKLGDCVYSNIENKYQLNNTLLYSDITLSEACFELLESSVPPNNNKSNMKLLISDDVEEQEGVTQTLLYTSEL